MSVIPPANLRAVLPKLSKRDARAIENVRKLISCRESRIGGVQLANALLRSATSDRVYNARAAHLKNLNLPL